MDDFLTEYQSDEFTPAEFAPFDFEDEDEDVPPLTDETSPLTL